MQELEMRRSRPAALTWELSRDQGVALAPNVGDVSQSGESSELRIPNVWNNVILSEPVGRSSHVEGADEYVPDREPETTLIKESGERFLSLKKTRQH
jgi:hypothetical protein